MQKKILTIVFTLFILCCICSMVLFGAVFYYFVSYRYQPSFDESNWEIVETSENIKIFYKTQDYEISDELENVQIIAANNDTSYLELSKKVTHKGEDYVQINIPYGQYTPDCIFIYENGRRVEVDRIVSGMLPSPSDSYMCNSFDDSLLLEN